MTLRLGIIADDYTGATDISVMLTKGGMRVLQVIGVPGADVVHSNIDALVVALKSRTIAAEEAVSQSIASHRVLRELGAEQIFFKYCSTFDSTKFGNIGPVADALLEETGAALAFVCPAFPANGRSVYMGQLFVGECPLAESSMRDHPLTPMRDSNLLRLMSAQSRHSVGLISWAVVSRGHDAICAAAERLHAEGHRYAVVDAITETDLHEIGAAAKGLPLVTGGSGVAMGLPANFGIAPGAQRTMPQVAGRSIVLAGSCSEATRQQINAIRDSWPVLKLDAHAIADGAPVAKEAVDWARQAEATPLIFATADPAEVTQIQSRYGVERAGEMIEDTFAKIARELVAHDFRRIVVAGGETSGAVLDGLGVSALNIYGEIDPGVPWTATPEGDVALALKSGNFGGPDFFCKAFEVLS